MENRLYYWELACYETSGNLPQRAIGKSNFIDFSLLPKETMREEYRRYFLYRGGQVSLNTSAMIRHITIRCAKPFNCEKTYLTASSAGSHPNGSNC